MVQFETIQDMLGHFYGSNAVAKADAPITSGTTGVFNAIYGAMAFSQLNNESNVFALMPKYPWQHSGYRAITARGGTTADGGVSEAATVPDSIKNVYAEIDVAVKEVSHVFEVSYRQEGLVGKDDAYGQMEQLRPEFSNLHALRINEQMLVDGDTLAGNSFESLDRITASTAYAAAVSWTSGDEDIYGIDRSANAWADAVVNHNSGTDRVLTLSLIEDTLASLADNGAASNLMITGNDTKWRIISLAQNSVRYQGVVKQDVLVQIGINGVETEEGMNFGVRVATVYDIPLFASQAVTKDTISRIYILDTTDDGGVPRLGISLLYPTMLFESGMTAADRNPFSINKFSTKGAYYTSGELVSTFLAAQGSVRDLK